MLALEQCIVRNLLIYIIPVEVEKEQEVWYNME